MTPAALTLLLALIRKGQARISIMNRNMPNNVSRETISGLRSFEASGPEMDKKDQSGISARCPQVWERHIIGFCPGVQVGSDDRRIGWILAVEVGFPVL